MLERDFQANVVQLATTTGWRVHHARNVQTVDGRHMTPIQGDIGFPDLVLARDGRVIFAELKSENGRLTKSQCDWLEALSGYSGFRGATRSHVTLRVEVHVWRPGDIQKIGKILSQR